MRPDGRGANTTGLSTNTHVVSMLKTELEMAGIAENWIQENNRYSHVNFRRKPPLGAPPVMCTVTLRPSMLP